MLHRIAETLATKVFGKDEKYIEIYVYGIELFISSMFCTLLLLIAGVITETLIESIIFIISFSALRIFTGGYHSNSYIACTMITMAIYFSVILLYHLAFKFMSSLFFEILISIVTIIVVCLFAPVENTNKHIVKSKVLIYKMKAVVISTLEIAICLVLNYYFNFHQIVIIIPILFYIDLLVVLPMIFRRKGGVGNEITDKKCS